MADHRWTEIDAFIEQKLVPADAALSAAVAESDSAGLPPIQVAPNQGKLLYLLARMLGARRVLEVGTLGGYSTIWLLRALPADGAMVTLEIDTKHAEVARKNIERAGFAKQTDLRVGAALDAMQSLAAERVAPFDLVFIDADKANNPSYFEAALTLTRPGSLILVDNVIRSGNVLDSDSKDPHIVGTRRLYDVVAKEPRVEATAVQTVGSKGHDGLLLARVK